MRDPRLDKLAAVLVNYSTAVKKGDLIMVFETSKTTYDVEAAFDGYIQYLCEPDHDYEVNTVVARIYSGAEEVSTSGMAGPAERRDFASPAAAGDGNWGGETLFSREAARLMGEARDVTGRVDSIAFGINDPTRSESGNLLPNVDPTFSWVRLAQRIPVRVKLDQVPPDIRLISGRTATVTVQPADKRTAQRGGCRHA